MFLPLSSITDQLTLIIKPLVLNTYKVTINDKTAYNWPYWTQMCYAAHSPHIQSSLDNIVFNNNSFNGLIIFYYNNYAFGFEW